MTKNYKSYATASPEQERMVKYKSFAVSLTYPDETFFQYFGTLVNRDKIILEYDRNFRAGIVWLYGTEHLATTEYDKVNQLADLMGFYRAFGVEPDKDRPDCIAHELEFMHYLIFKTINLPTKNVQDTVEKRNLCLQAQKNFFTDHMYPTAKVITEKIITQISSEFYTEIARDLLNFIQTEKRYFSSSKV